MTAKISQHVTPRRLRGSLGARARSAQRGSITPGAITTTLAVTTLVIVALLSFFYLQQVLHTASEGTDMHALKTKLIELEQQQRELELQGARLRSLQNVEEHIQKMNLAPTDRVTYLELLPDHVATLAD